MFEFVSKCMMHAQVLKCLFRSCYMCSGQPSHLRATAADFKGEITSVTCRLTAVTGLWGSANIQFANPALLRLVKAEGKEGPHRGVGVRLISLQSICQGKAATLSPAPALVSAV